jgi:hypothetical protein
VIKKPGEVEVAVVVVWSHTDASSAFSSIEE